MTHKNSRRRFVAPALLVSIFLISFVTAYAAPPTVSIAEARSLPLGTVVTIDGVVTVPSGAFSSSTFDQGFAIQEFADHFEVDPRVQTDIRVFNCAYS